MRGNYFFIFYFQRAKNCYFFTDDANFLEGLNVCQGHVTYKAVADVFGHKYISAKEAIN